MTCHTLSFETMLLQNCVLKLKTTYSTVDN
uniref:Uncharacterized protein n=1 Tax=Arundo donax TaxID=35708 RepID=A0A0A9HJ67_ARUDO